MSAEIYNRKQSILTALRKLPKEVGGHYAYDETVSLLVGIDQELWSLLDWLEEEGELDE